MICPLAYTFLLPSLFMKGTFGILMVIAVLCIPGKCLGDADPGVLSLADRLDSIDNYAATISYAVSLPMADDDVVYTLNVATSRNPSDHLLGENYLIDWTLPAESGESRGFTAYFDGHHYRYRDHRLQENHYMWDSIPFRTNAGGIQRNGQFVNLLPFSLSSQLRAMAADSTWTVSLAEGLAERRKADIVSARRHVNGIESQQLAAAADFQVAEHLHRLEQSAEHRFLGGTCADYVSADAVDGGIEVIETDVHPVEGVAAHYLHA